MASTENRFDRYVRWLSGAQTAPNKATTLGGFPYLTQDGTIAPAYRKLAEEIDILPVPAEAKETAELAVAAHYGARGEIAWLSRQAKALAPSQIKSIVEGIKPHDLTPAGRAAYDAVTYLVAIPGPLPPQYWENCIELLGKNGTIGIIHLVGLHIGASVVANAIDAPVISAEGLQA